MQGCVKKRRQRILIGVLVVTTLSACGALAEDGPLSGSGKGEGFDKDNAPELLHPAFAERGYRLLANTMPRGEADRKPFLSNYWSTLYNGIAARWQTVPYWSRLIGNATDLSPYENLADKDMLAPTEKYDLLVYPGNQQVAQCGGRLVDSAGTPVASAALAEQLRNQGTLHCQSWEWADWQAENDRLAAAYAARNPSDAWPHDEDALYPSTTGKRRRLPRVAGPTTSWELAEHGALAGITQPGWGGHCNGVVMYTIAEELGYPKRDVAFKLLEQNGVRTLYECRDRADSACLTFRRGDIEALMTEVYYHEPTTGAGGRCNKDLAEIKRDKYGRPTQTECRDLNPGTFHIALSGFLGQGVTDGGVRRRRAFFADVAADDAVWNYAVASYEVLKSVSVSKRDAMELIADKRKRYLFNGDAARYQAVVVAYDVVKNSITPTELAAEVESRAPFGGPTTRRQLAYVLELTKDNEIIGGEWARIELDSDEVVDSRMAHPDFAALPRQIPPGGDTKAVVYPNGNVEYPENPFINYDVVRQMLYCANNPGACLEPAAAPPVVSQPPAGQNGQRVCRAEAGCRITKYSAGCPATLPEGSTIRVVSVSTFGSWMFDRDAKTRCAIAPADQRQWQ